jgi:hypothetical protein
MILYMKNVTDCGDMSQVIQHQHKSRYVALAIWNYKDICQPCLCLTHLISHAFFTKNSDTFAKPAFNTDGVFA